MELLTIHENQNLQQAVDAKELYQALGLDSTQWSRWSKQNIQDNPFALKGTDYGVYDLMSNTQGGRPTTNYLLSIDFAKKLAMQVRTEKGEQVRDYFLECERKTQQSVMALPDFFDPVAAARAFADEYEAKRIAQEQLAIAAPKAAALDQIAAAEGSLNARDTAKTLGIKPGKFNTWAIKHKWMYKDSQERLQPHSDRIQQGYMTMRPVTYKGRNGDKKATTQAMFTPRGLVRLAEIFAIVKEVA